MGINGNLGRSDDGEVLLVGNTDGTLIGNTGDRLHVDAQVSASPVPLTDVIYSIDHLKNGSSYSMVVNGSSTPVNFDFSPPSGETWYLESMNMFLVDTGTTSANNFGAISGNLTNGLIIKIRSKGTEYTLVNIKDNTDIMKVFNEHAIIPPTSGFIETSDSFSGEIKFDIPMKLQNSTGDYLRVTVRDNLTTLDQLEMMYRAWKTI